eukprot:scaffold91497_cov46-Phaeocystis_antarctica.AAC.1
MAEPAREPRVSGVCARGRADRGKAGAETLALSGRSLVLSMRATKRLAESAPNASPGLEKARYPPHPRLT